jgi:hypothetical protein
MNVIIDAFLELPTWQAVALIALAVTVGMVVCFLVSLTIEIRNSRIENVRR